jgi:hypothetical protein
LDSGEKDQYRSDPVRERGGTGKVKTGFLTLMRRKTDEAAMGIIVITAVTSAEVA